MCPAENGGLDLLSRTKWTYIYFTDLQGVFRRVLVRSDMLDEEAFREGLGKLDGSSVKGFTSIDESDMVLKPDPDTIMPYPFHTLEEPVARLIAEVYKPGGKERYPRDPRLAARRTVELLASQGLRAVMGAELEFFIFDSVSVQVEPWYQSLEISSIEGPWEGEAPTLNLMKDGYYVPAPRDTTEDLKLEIAGVLEEYYGIRVEVLHHEVAAASQHEINFQPGNPLETGDRIQLIKEAVRTIAAEEGYAATFMPKPLYGDNGNGMHVHVSIWEGDKNIFYDENDDYAGISQYARYFIGGIIEHGRALSAIVNPTVNSYKRLVPGFEAPIYLAWSRANRSAAIRIPVYKKKMSSARLEYRSPDPSVNPYLALSAIILAGLDGVRRKIDPGSPVDENIYRMSPERRRQLGIKVLPRSLDEALDCLETDNEWLLQAWPKDLVEAYIELKREEARTVNSYVSPAEIQYYFGL